MQQTEFISGFSELKELLIKTYNIETDKALVRLYFTESNNELLMHDYDNHKKVICLCSNLKDKIIKNGLPTKAMLLVNESIDHASAAQFLNFEFKLSGFFR